MVLRRRLLVGVVAQAAACLSHRRGIFIVTACSFTRAARRPPPAQPFALAQRLLRRQPLFLSRVLLFGGARVVVDPGGLERVVGESVVSAPDYSCPPRSFSVAAAPFVCESAALGRGRRLLDVAARRLALEGFRSWLSCWLASRSFAPRAPAAMPTRRLSGRWQPTAPSPPAPAPS